MADTDANLYELTASDTKARKAAQAKGETSIPRLNFLNNSNCPVETRKAKKGSAAKGGVRAAPKEGSRADLAIKLRRKRTVASAGTHSVHPSSGLPSVPGSLETHAVLGHIIEKAKAADLEKFRAGTVARCKKGRGAGSEALSPKNQSTQKFITLKMDAQHCDP